MRIGFCLNQIKNREVNLAMDFAAGLHIHGHEVKQIGNDQEITDVDIACVIGVKSMWRMAECRKKGIPFLYFDKGYNRKAGHWRVAINGHQPTDYFSDWTYGDDRRKQFGWYPPKWKKDRFANSLILIAGSSLKFHEFKGLAHPTEYAKDLVTQVREFTKRNIVYRPKPSWKEAEPIKDTRFSRHKGIKEVLPEVGVLITYGSNACFEALLNGIPSIVLGDGITRSISSQEIADVNAPRRVSMERREHLLNQLAYCQFSPDEMNKGIAWEIIEKQLQTVLK